MGFGVRKDRRILWIVRSCCFLMYLVGDELPYFFGNIISSTLGSISRVTFLASIYVMAASVF